MITIDSDTLPVLDALIGDMACGLAEGGNDDENLADYLARLKAFRARLTPGLPLGPGEDDAKVWIPPLTDCLDFGFGPCEHCGESLGLHRRTSRCGNCGRRVEVVAGSTR